MGSSVALGVIAGKCGSLRLVLAGPAGCLRGRWRSGSWKWRHAAGTRARGRKHRAPVGALRLIAKNEPAALLGRQEAPRTCRCIKTRATVPATAKVAGRKHRAPVGALRHTYGNGVCRCCWQEAPRTCRCIKTKVQWSPLMRYVSVSKHLAPVGVLRPEGRVGESRFSYEVPLC